MNLKNIFLIIALLFFYLTAIGQTNLTEGWYRVAETDQTNAGGIINLTSSEGTLKIAAAYTVKSLNAEVRDFYVTGVGEYVGTSFTSIRFVKSTPSTPAYIDVYVDAAVSNAVISVESFNGSSITPLVAIPFATPVVPNDYLSIAFPTNALEYVSGSLSLFGVAGQTDMDASPENEMQYLYTKGDSICISGRNCELIPTGNGTLTSSYNNGVLTINGTAHDLSDIDTDIDTVTFNANNEGKLKVEEDGVVKETTILSQASHNKLSIGPDGGILYNGDWYYSNPNLFNVANQLILTISNDTDQLIESSVNKAPSSDLDYGVLKINTAVIQSGKRIYLKYAQESGGDFKLKVVSETRTFDIDNIGADTLTLENPGDWAILLVANNRYIVLGRGTGGNSIDNSLSEADQTWTGLRTVAGGELELSTSDTLEFVSPELKISAGGSYGKDGEFLGANGDGTANWDSLTVDDIKGFEEADNAISKSDQIFASDYRKMEGLGLRINTTDSLNFVSNSTLRIANTDASGEILLQPSGQTLQAGQVVQIADSKGKVFVDSLDYNKLKNKPVIPNDTNLSEAQVDAYVANNNYLTAESQNLLQVLNQNNSAGNNKIADLAIGVNPADAVNKSQLDAVNNNIPQNVSQLANDAGYLSSIPSIVSQNLGFKAQIEEIDSPWRRSNQNTIVEFEDSTVVFYNVHTSVGDFSDRNILRKASVDRKNWGSSTNVTSQLGASPDGFGPPSALRLNGDTLLMIINTNDGTYYAGTGYDSDVYYALSYDRGLTWQARQTLVDDTAYYPAAPDKLFRSSSGRIFFTTAYSTNGGTSSQTLTAQMTLWYSDDEGGTWTRVNSGVQGPNGKTFEPGLFENIYTGRLYTFFRTQDGYVWFSHSDDDGATWATAYRSNLIAENAQSDILQIDGILYAVTAIPELNPYDGSTADVDYNRKKYHVSTATYNAADEFTYFNSVYTLNNIEGDKWGQLNNVSLSHREGSLFVYYSETDRTTSGASGTDRFNLTVKHIPIEALSTTSVLDRREGAIYDRGLLIGAGVGAGEYKIPTNTIRYASLTPNTLTYLDDDKDLRSVSLGSGLTLNAGVLTADGGASDGVVNGGSRSGSDLILTRTNNLNNVTLPNVFSSSTLQDYSTSEQVFGRRSHDGKYVYWKTFDIGQVPISGYTGQITGGNPIEDLLKIEVSFKNNGFHNAGGGWINVAPNDEIQTFVLQNSTEFKVVNGVSATIDNYLATLYYTKPAYSLNVTATNGSVSLNPSGGSYEAGTQVTITASANSGYDFDNYSGDFSSNGNPITITMPSNNVTMAANFVASGGGGGGQSVTWTSFLETSATGNTLERISGAANWIGGAISSQVIPANTDGYVEFTAQGGKGMIIGFNDVDNNGGYAEFEHAIYLHRSDGSVKVYENNVATGNLETYVAGDVFSIERVGSNVEYKKNGTTFRTIAANTAAFFMDCSIRQVGGQVIDAKIDF